MSVFRAEGNEGLISTDENICVACDRSLRVTAVFPSPVGMPVPSSLHSREYQATAIYRFEKYISPVGCIVLAGQMQILVCSCYKNSQDTVLYHLTQNGLPQE